MKTITSCNNEFIKYLYKLKQKKYHDLYQEFLVEGYNLVIEAKNYIKYVLINDEKDQGIIGNKEYILVTEEIIKKLAQTKTPQGIIGICDYPKNKLLNTNRVLILDGIQDPGNIGTIMRTAVAFDINTIYLSEDCVDVYNEKVIRSSLGALFKLSIIRNNIISVINDLKTKGFYIIGTSLQNAVSLEKLNEINKYAIILGNEGNGVKKEILSQTDVNIYIPISNNMESLNVGIAAGIIIYNLTNKS